MSMSQGLEFSAGPSQGTFTAGGKLEPPQQMVAQPQVDTRLIQDPNNSQ